MKLQLQFVAVLGSRVRDASDESESLLSAATWECSFSAQGERCGPVLAQDTTRVSTCL